MSVRSLRADQFRGDLTKINVKPGDWGGQFDSAEHHPDGAKVFGGADKKEASSWVVRNLLFSHETTAKITYEARQADDTDYDIA